jgi:hypothetical protein
LSQEWEAEDGRHYSIVRLTDSRQKNPPDAANSFPYLLTDTDITDSVKEILHIADAKFTAILDFTFSPDGLIYFIERNAGVGKIYLKTLNPENLDIETLCELPEGTSSLAIDSWGSVYLANPEAGTIQVWQDGALSYFAGLENEKAFIDGAAPLFYMPQKIKYADGFLFVWDFNVLRKIAVKDGVAGECTTVAGEASPVFDMDVTQTSQAAEEIILPNSKLTDFAVKDGKILITDPKRGVIWQTE